MSHDDDAVNREQNFDDDTDSHSPPCTTAGESGRFMNFSLLLLNYLVNLNFYSPHTSDAVWDVRRWHWWKDYFSIEFPSSLLLLFCFCRKCVVEKKFSERSLRGVKNYYFISFVWVNLFLTDSNDRVLAALKFFFFGVMFWRHHDFVLGCFCAVWVLDAIIKSKSSNTFLSVACYIHFVFVTIRFVRHRVKRIIFFQLTTYLLNNIIKFNLFHLFCHWNKQKKGKTIFHKKLNRLTSVIWGSIFDIIIVLLTPLSHNNMWVVRDSKHFHFEEENNLQTRAEMCSASYHTLTLKSLLHFSQKLSSFFHTPQSIASFFYHTFLICFSPHSTWENLINDVRACFLVLIFVHPQLSSLLLCFFISSFSSSIISP